MVRGVQSADFSRAFSGARKNPTKVGNLVKTTKSDTLDQLFSQCASYVESVAGPDESVISSAGMDPKAAGGAPTLPDAPTGLDVTIGDHEGDLDLSWDTVSNAKSYLIQQSADPNHAAGWTHAGTSTKSSTTIGRPDQRHPPLVSCLRRPRHGPSGWGDPATKIAP